MRKYFNSATITKIGIFSALSIVLYLINIPLPFLFPPFLKLNLSDLPSLICGFAVGPMGPHHAPRPVVHHTTYVTHNVPPRHHVHRGYRHHHHMSPGAKTAVAVAGVAGLALMIAAIAD